MADDYQDIGDVSQLQEQPNAAPVKIDLSQIKSIKSQKKPNEGGGWEEKTFNQKQDADEKQDEKGEKGEALDQESQDDEESRDEEGKQEDEALLDDEGDDEESEDDDSEDSDEDQDDDEEESEEDESDEDSDDSEDPDEESEEDDDEELDSDSDEGDEESEEDESEQTLNKEEFNVYAETDGVFESIDDLKKTSALLKENPELKGMLDYFEENGTLLPYLQATQVDVDQMSDMDVLEGKFRDEYGAHFGNLTDDQISAMFKKKVLSRYDLDSEDEGDKALAIAEMTMDANKLRAELKKEQQTLLLPKDRDDQAERDKKEADKKKALDALKNKLSYQIRKEIKDGKLSVKVNEDTSAMLKVSPKKITSLLDKTSDLSLFTDQNGKFDLQRMAILVDTEGFMSQVQSNLKADGKSDFVKENLKKRPKKKGRKPEGQGKPKETKPLDPRDLRSFKGVKVKRIGRSG